MPVVTVGKTRIPYEIRRSTRAKRRRIVVVPEKVEVVAPIRDRYADINAFVNSRRRWIYDKRQRMHEYLSRSNHGGPERFVTGAKIPYRGRQMRLTVRMSGEVNVQVEYRNGFIVHRPEDGNDSDIKAAIEGWLLERIKKDVDGYVRLYGKKLDVTPRAVRIKDMKHLWGSCGKNGIIHLNSRLVFAPKPVLEYAALHELCHLRYRNHSKGFWILLRQTMPNYEYRKIWLEKNQGTLSQINL